VVVTLDVNKGERVKRFANITAVARRKLRQLEIADRLDDLRVPPGNRLAKEIGVPAQRIGEIVAGKRAITADTDLRLCRFFGLSNGYWLRAQAVHDTEVAERALGTDLAKIKPWKGVAVDGRRVLTRA
jgi:addiction module HigA family antidote